MNIKLALENCLFACVISMFHCFRIFILLSLPKLCKNTIVGMVFLVAFSVQCSFLQTQKNNSPYHIFVAKIGIRCCSPRTVMSLKLARLECTLSTKPS